MRHLTASLLAGTAALLAATAPAPANTTKRVSVSSAEAQANSFSSQSTISANGRFVAFTSLASNLVRGDTNDAQDVFLRDLRAGTTSLVSAAFDGGPANGSSGTTEVSTDGCVVAFFSGATNLVRDDFGLPGIYARDCRTGKIERVDIDQNGDPGSDALQLFALSLDGRYVAWSSSAGSLVAGDGNDAFDIFVRDRVRRATTRVSVATGGGEGDGFSTEAAISGDGRYVAFASSATNLVPGDENGSTDIFLHDRRTGQTTRVSVPPGGGEANEGSFSPSISGDGRFVGFASNASNLVPGDTNAVSDAFVLDRRTGSLVRASVSTSEEEGNNLGGFGSNLAQLSANGRHALVFSDSTNLVPRDRNNIADLFVRDLVAGTTRRVSLGVGNVEADGTVSLGGISRSGGRVVFDSDATNLVRRDTNGAGDVFLRTR